MHGWHQAVRCMDGTRLYGAWMALWQWGIRWYTGDGMAQTWYTGDGIAQAWYTGDGMAQAWCRWTARPGLAMLSDLSSDLIRRVGMMTHFF